MATSTKTKAKAARPPLTRERIADVAVSIMDAEGLEAVTMRRLGRELGVEAMSLYNHVEDRSDLEGAMIERVMNDFVLPSDEVKGWEERVRVMARSYRDVLMAHPDVMQLFADHEKPPTTAVAPMRPMEMALQTLQSAGLSDEETIDTYKTFGGYIMGFVLMESRQMLRAPEGVPPEVVTAGLPDELPMVKRLFPMLCVSDATMDFDYGINMLIAGMRERVRPRGAAKARSKR